MWPNSGGQLPLLLVFLSRKSEPSVLTTLAPYFVNNSPKYMESSRGRLPFPYSTLSGFYSKEYRSLEGPFFKRIICLSFRLGQEWGEGLP